MVETWIPAEVSLRYGAVERIPGDGGFVAFDREHLVRTFF